MKTLKEYIESQKYHYPQDDWQTLESFLEVNKINEASKDDLNWYANYVCDVNNYNNPAKFVNNYGSPIEQIDEMLKSSTFSIVKKELNKKLAKNGYSIRRDTDEIEFHQGEKTVNTIEIPVEIFDLDILYDVCEKHMWTVNSFAVTDIRYKASGEPYEFEDSFGKYFKFRIEPIQSENKDDFVFNKCKGIVYHLCEKDKLKSIMKSGLRMKGKNNLYRMIENKVFFVAEDNKENLKRTIKRVARSKGYWDWKNNKLKDNVCILKVDVNGYNIHFYEDTYYDDGEKIGVIYSYAYFPPKMIEEINFEDIIK